MGGCDGAGSLLPAMFVAANRWSADEEPGQETRVTVLYMQRPGGLGLRERERVPVGGWWVGGGVVSCRGCGCKLIVCI